MAVSTPQLTKKMPESAQNYGSTSDRAMHQSFMRKTQRIVEKIFHESCKELIVKHPMFESALSQIIAVEDDTQMKVRNRQEWNQKQRLMHAQTVKNGKSQFKHNTNMMSAGGAGPMQSTDPSQQIAETVVNVHIDVKSYKEHSDMLNEIQTSYKGLIDENKKLWHRIGLLKSQHDKETSALKHTQFVQADKDMQALQMYRQQRNQARLGGLPDRSDEALDEYQNKIVPVEFFDPLEGIDKELREELNVKLAKVRNQFQELLETNLKTVDKLKDKIKLMNDLSPDAYSIANLSLVEIFLGIAKKENDPARIWKALKKAYGEDYFLTVVEEQYGKRFVANYNALYSEVDKVKEQADKEFAEIEETYK